MVWLKIRRHDIVCKVLDSELLDPKKTSQAFWIDMQKLAQEKIESMPTQNKE